MKSLEQMEAEQRVFESLTAAQKERVESLEIAEHSLMQLAQDMNSILVHRYCAAEMSAKSKANLKQAMVEILMERERMLGEIESIRHG